LVNPPGKKRKKKTLERRSIGKDLPQKTERGKKWRGKKEGSKKRRRKN